MELKKVDMTLQELLDSGHAQPSKFKKILEEFLESGEEVASISIASTGEKFETIYSGLKRVAKQMDKGVIVARRGRSLFLANPNAVRK